MYKVEQVLRLRQFAWTGLSSVPYWRQRLSLFKIIAFRGLSDCIKFAPSNL